jgi:uncharacterized protein (DUF2236 family)
VQLPLTIPVGFTRRDSAPSVAWRVNAERLVVLGWTRAILLQFAHPLVAAGVHDHSGFRGSPLAAVQRLRHTVGAMLALSFGSEIERERTIATIRAIHRRVNGTLGAAVGPFPAGTRYSAEDPALVLWVHLTLLESIVMTYEMLVGPLTDRERDAYCEESACVAIALGASEADVPRTWHGVRVGIERVTASGVIVISAEARALARAVVRPRGASITGPVMWCNEALTVGLLPAPLREQYGFRWQAHQRRAFGLIVGAIRLIRRYAPNRVALWRDARAA